jgi:hypothetical protein
MFVTNTLAIQSLSAAADARVAEVIDRLSPKDHPHLAALSEELLSGTPTTRLIWSFEVLINGIAATPRAETQPHQTAKAGATMNKGAQTGRARRRS